MSDSQASESDNGPAQEPQATGSASQREVSRWWKAWDLILVLGFLSLTPLLYQYVMELWNDIELRFFPLLPLVSIVLITVLARRGNCTTKVRAIFAILLLVLSTAAAGYGAWKLLPWFGALALVLLVLSWMLARLGETAWYRPVGWLLPTILLLTFPLAPAYDLRIPMEMQVSASSSGLLDMLGIPHLVTEGLMVTENSRIPVMRVCAGVGSPYVLLTLALLLLMFTEKRFVVGLLTMLLVPVWSWLASTTHLTLGLYLLEENETVLFTEQRNLLVQAGLVLLGLLFTWITSIAFRNLLSPFPGYSQTANEVHKLYNWLVYWPEPNPLRKRRSKDEVEFTPKAFWEMRPVQICLIACASILVIGGGYSGYQVFLGA